MGILLFGTCSLTTHGFIDLEHFIKEFQDVIDLHADSSHGGETTAR